MDVDFLVSPLISCEDYQTIPFDASNPRAIPLPDGAFGDNPFVTVSDGGKKVTFNMQQGPTLESSNGTYVDAMILFSRTLLEERNKLMPSRYNAIAITHLEEANLALFARAADRHARGVQGTINK